MSGGRYQIQRLLERVLISNRLDTRVAVVRY